MAAPQARAVAPDNSFWQLNISGDSTNEVTISEDPEIITAGNTVHVLSVARVQTDWNAWRLVYTRSIDGGKSFQPPIVLVESAGLDKGIGRFQRMAVDGQYVHIASTRSPVSGGDWYYTLDYYRSTNNGASFEEGRVLNTGAVAWHMHMPHILAAGGKVRIAYLYYPNWYTDSALSILKSEDNGSTFSPLPVMRTNSEGYDLWDFRQDGEKMAVAVIASSGIGGTYSYKYRLLVAASVDGGANWTVNQINSTNAAGWPQAEQMSDYQPKPDLAWAGDHLYVTWTGQDTNSERAAFVARSTDNGRTFEPQVNLSSGHTGVPQAGQATVAARGDFAYVVWNAPSSGIWLRRSKDGGATWEAAQSVFRGGWWPMVAIDPESADGRKVHFLATGGVYRTSEDGGATLTSPLYVSTVWSWWGSGIKNFQWSFGQGGKVHLAFTGYAAKATGDDYDLYYRLFDPVAPSLQPGNQGLVVQANHGQAHYENLQIPFTPALAFANTLTVEMWVRPDTNCPVDAIYLNQGYPDDYRGSLQLQFHNYNGRRPSGKLLTTNGIVEVWGGELMRDEEWHHVAMTYDAAAGPANLRLYVDGHLSATATGIGPVKQAGNQFITTSGSYSAFSGTLDEIRLWNRALTETELRVHTTARLRAQEPGLVAYYPLDGSTKEATGLGRDGVLMYREFFTPATRQYPVTITGPALSGGSVGHPFLFEVAADWATGFSVTSGSVPPGLTFDGALGQFSGIPTAVGAYEMVVSATNDFGGTSQTVRIVVSDSTGTLFRDDFNNRTNAAWDVVRNDPAKYSFYPGGMRLLSSWADIWGCCDNNAANLFSVLTPTEGDFTVTLGVSKFAPSPNRWVQLFLMAYDGDNDYLRYGYGWGDQRALSVVKEVGGAPGGVGVAQDMGDGGFQLRLAKQGSLYAASWSTNGVDFVTSHEPVTFGDGTPGRLVFWLGIDPTYTNAALLDFFEVKAEATPIITSPSQTAGRAGTPLAWPISGPANVQFSASGLPAGLSINPTSGLISGTPVENGIFEVTVRASNYLGVTTQRLRLAIEPPAPILFREDFNGSFVAGWNPLPGDTSYYHLTNGSQLWVRANNGDTWQWYNRELNLFAVNAPGASDWVATLAVSRYEPTAVNYNSIHLVSWNDTDNNVRLNYSYGNGRGLGITAENAQAMTSYGGDRDFGSAPFFLRLVKQGHSYKGYYGTNGFDFLPVSTNAVSLDRDPLQIGFWMGIDPTLANNALVDYFEVVALASPSTPVVIRSTDPGNTTGDLFAGAAINTSLSSPARAGFSLGDAFGASTSTVEPGRLIFADAAPGAVSTLCFALPSPATLDELSVWLMEDPGTGGRRAASHFALKLADAQFNVISTLAETDLHIPYGDPVSAGGYGTNVIRVTASFAPVTAQYFVAEFRQATSGVDGGVRVVEIDAGTSLVTRPRLAVQQSSNGGLLLSWNALTSREYQLQYTTALGSGPWENLGSVLSTAAGVLTLEDPVGLTQQRYYRVLLAP